MFKLKMIFALLVFGVFSLAQGGVIVGATRFIYKSNARDVSVRLTNEGNEPALVQLWIDDGDASMQPSKINVPFVISSPLVRIDSKQSHSLRIIATNPQLPGDRETMYWLNVLEVPPKPKSEEEQSYLQFSVRSRMKLIYRPEPVSSDVIASAKSAKILIIQEKPLIIKVVNESPNYLNFGEVVLMKGSEKTGPTLYATVAPFGNESLKFEYPEAIGASKETLSIIISAIDDFGGSIKYEVPLTVAPKSR